jgi:hypothetical protein
MGAWLGSLIVFANYSRAIDIFEGGNGQLTLKSASFFSAYPVSSFPPSLFFLSVSDIGKFFRVSLPTYHQPIVFSMM